MSRTTLYRPAGREWREVDLADREGLRKAIIESFSPKRAFLSRIGLTLGLNTSERHAPPAPVAGCDCRLRAGGTLPLGENHTDHSPLRHLALPGDITRTAALNSEGAVGLGDFLREAELLQRYGQCGFHYFTATLHGDLAAARLPTGSQFLQ